MMIVFWGLFAKSNKKIRYYIEAHMVYSINPEHMEKRNLKFVEIYGKHP